MADRIARNHRPGHIGSTPQDTDETLAGGRVAGMLADFTSRLSPRPRVDAYLGRPQVAADPGYFRDDSAALAIGGAVSRMQPSVMRSVPDAKTVQGYDPASPDQLDVGSGL